MMLSRLKTSKAFWAAVGGILIAVGMGFNGQMEWEMVARTCFDAVLVIFVRDGIAKGK